MQKEITHARMSRADRDTGTFIAKLFQIDSSKAWNMILKIAVDHIEKEQRIKITGLDLTESKYSPDGYKSYFLSKDETETAEVS